MKVRQRKNKIKQGINIPTHYFDDRLYCVNCGKKLDLKGNEFSIKYGACDSYCYGKAVGCY